jgi:hypothetical protein
LLWMGGGRLFPCAMCNVECGNQKKPKANPSTFSLPTPSPTPSPDAPNTNKPQNQQAPPTSTEAAAALISEAQEAADAVADRLGRLAQRLQLEVADVAYRVGARAEREGGDEAASPSHRWWLPPWLPPRATRDLDEGFATARAICSRMRGCRGQVGKALFALAPRPHYKKVHIELNSDALVSLQHNLTDTRNSRRPPHQLCFCRPQPLKRGARAVGLGVFLQTIQVGGCHVCWQRDH